MKAKLVGGAYGNGQSQASRRVRKQRCGVQRGEETEKGPRWRWVVCLVPLKNVIILPNWVWRDHLHLHLPQDFTSIHFQLSHLRIFKTSARNNFLNPFESKRNIFSSNSVIFFFFSARQALSDWTNPSWWSSAAAEQCSFLVTVIRGESVAPNL